MVVFKDTRGRRSASQKIRDWFHLFRGAGSAGDAARTITDAVGSTALFATLAYTGRPKIISTLNPENPSNPTGYTELIVLQNKVRTESQYVVPTLLGRPVKYILIVHPDVGVTEGLGILALLTALPGGDLTGFIEKGVGIGLYHALLNGFSFNIPGVTGTSMSLLDAAGWDSLFKTISGFGSSLANLLGIPGAPPPPTGTAIAFSGLMGGLVWNLWHVQQKLQADIDSGKLVWPLKLNELPAKGTVPGRYGLAYDGVILPLYIQRWLHDIGHAGLILLLFRRGLGQKLNE